MLIQFCVGNYRSFHDPVTLSLVAAKLKSRDKEIDANNVFDVGHKLRLLTSAAIYGANASGKSNLVRAMQVMRRIVLHSAEGTAPTGEIPVERFRLSTATRGQPSYFQVVFLLDGVRYRYGFEATQERIVSEWLFYVPKTVEARLFERDQDQFRIGDGFREGKEIAERTRSNALLLSVAAQFNSTKGEKVVDWFRKSLLLASGSDDANMRMATMHSLEDPEQGKRILELVHRLDLGISGLQYEWGPLESDQLRIPSELPEELRVPAEAFENALREYYRRVGNDERQIVSVKTLHLAFNSEGKPASPEAFDLDEHESDGTKKLFSLAGALIQALLRGQLLVIDELDARLHPLITRAIIALFNSVETNPNHAQLVFTTQDASLLDRRIFRRDQIWFTEKDPQGASQLYSLADFRVRNDASFGPDYIRGKYGAIPYLSDLGQVLDGEE